MARSLSRSDESRVDLANIDGAPGTASEEPAGQAGQSSGSVAHWSSEGPGSQRAAGQAPAGACGWHGPRTALRRGSQVKLRSSGRP